MFLLAILAGAVQGLTEFLPVSSTGHLIIFEHIFGISPENFGLSFDASLHLGTLAAILIFFWHDYVRMFESKNRLLAKIIVGTIPAVFFGLIFENQIESVLRQTWVVGTALVLFSLVLVLAEKLGKQTKTGQKTTLRGALVIGFFQSIALIPGISRSGSTISAGLLLGLKREEAARFAFLLSGPIVAGAGLKKFLDAVSIHGIGSGELSFFIIGMVSSAFFGYLTIKYFLAYLATKTLYPFVVYRLILGLILLAPYF